jgi:hypothetical protein
MNPPRRIGHRIPDPRSPIPEECEPMRICAQARRGSIGAHEEYGSSAMFWGRVA